MRESAKLKTAMDEVVYNLEMASKENDRLKEVQLRRITRVQPRCCVEPITRVLSWRRQEADKTKLEKVMGRFMIRKMREKMSAVQVACPSICHVIA